MSIPLEGNRASGFRVWRLLSLLLFVPLVLSAAGAGRANPGFAVSPQTGTPPVAHLDVCSDAPLCTDPLPVLKLENVWAWDNGSSDSDGLIVSYEIDWGDGSSENGSFDIPYQSFGVHQYTKSGRYTVRLTLTDNDGLNDTDNKTVLVGNLPPTASFTFSPASPHAGDPVTFDGSGSSDPDGTVVSWEWDFGDGTNATGNPITHAYANATNYTVTLTVTDDDGASGSTNQSISVQPPLNQAPTISACYYTPDPRTNASYVCGGTNNPPGYVNVTIGFNVTVSDAEGDNITVTFYFDYYNIVIVDDNATKVLNPLSPRVDINVTPSGPGEPVEVTTNWTYDRLSNNTLVANESSRYWVRIETRDARGANDTTQGRKEFGLTVRKNTRAYLDGLKSQYPLPTPKIEFPQLNVPLVYVNVTVKDSDYVTVVDTVVVTWEWGDGTVNVYTPLLVNGSADLNLTHQYPIGLFPLNVTAADITFNITAWADDGHPGHNETPASGLPGEHIAVFQLWYDFPPSVSFDKDEPILQVLWWKVGETVPMWGRATDPESQPITAYYWDFDNKTDSNGDGDPERDRDAVGNVTSHVYTAPGFYGLTLWATDGENKINCWSESNCTGTNRTDHWSRARRLIEVRENTLPLLIAGSPLFVGLVGEPVVLRAVMIEEDGDNMTVTWDFGDGTPIATNLTSGGERGAGKTINVNMTHAYAAVGFYNLTIRVNDGNATNETVALVFVGSANLAPTVFGFTVLTANYSVRINTTFRVDEMFFLQVNVTDPERDAVAITVDWGDGASNVTTAVADGGQYVEPRVAHSYSEPGEFKINITVTDNKQFLWLIDPANLTVESRPHTAWRDGPTIIVPSLSIIQTEAPWDWWDYSTLAAVLGVPGFFTGRVAWRISKERREE